MGENLPVKTDMRSTLVSLSSRQCGKRCRDFFVFRHFTKYPLTILHSHCMLTVLEQTTQLYKESAMETIKLINFIIATVFFICYSYQFAYILVPYLKKEKPHKPVELHRYAV